MFDKTIYNSLKKRVDPYLEPGEELLNVTMVEASGAMHGYLVGGEIGVSLRGAARDRKRSDADASNGTDSGVNLASANMTLAVTSRRLLIFKFGSGRSANPKDLLTNVPIGEVDSIEVGGSRLATKPLRLTVRGQSFELEVRRAVNTDILISAFEQARSSTTVRSASAEASGDPVAPADWYADPQHVARLRYWDGTRWTDNTAS